MKPFKAALVAALTVAAIPSVFSQEDEQKQLKDIERQIEQSKNRQQDLKQKAERVADESQALSAQMVALAKNIQDQEQALSDLEVKMQGLENDIADKQSEIRKQNKNMAHTLGALERLSQRPPEYILMRPATAVETVRSASLLNTVLPAIEDRAAAMKQDLTELSAMKGQLSEERARHSAQLEDLRGQYASLEKAQKEKRALYADYLQGVKSEQQKTERLGREAKDLQSLIARLEEEMKSSTSQMLPTPPIPPGSSFAKVKGKLPYPARGQITQHFGDKVPAGTAKGIEIRTISGATVVAPFDGRIIYAGEFRTYGRLLIIAHGDGYHSLVAGLGRIDVMVGQWVLAGEPVGAMPETRLAASDNKAAPGPDVYFEIRKNGDPINPLPWLHK